MKANSTPTKAAKRLPSAQKSKPAEVSHPREILASVRPQDAAAVKSIARAYESYSLATVAGAIAGFGEMVLRREDVACQLEYRRSATYLWMAINRDAEDYSTKLPVVIGEEETQLEHQNDARNIGRDFSDWLGTLIMIGLKVVGNKDALAACSRGWEMSLFLGHEAHQASKDQQDGGAA